MNTEPEVWRTPWRVANFYDKPNTEEDSLQASEDIANPLLISVKHKSYLTPDVTLRFPIRYIDDYHASINHFTRVINEVIRRNGEHPNRYDTDGIRERMLKIVRLSGTVYS